MVNELGLNTIVSEFIFHCLPHTCGLVSNLDLTLIHKYVGVSEK